jgi:hypothetical protein
MPKDWPFDLFLNVTAELIGIVATVFLIDRLLERRERRRWLPAKNLVYSELLTVTAQVLACATPNRERTNLVYSFGAVTTTVDMPKDLQSLTEASDVDDIAIELSIRTSDERAHLADRLTGLGSDVSGCLRSSEFLIEPELLSMLLRLRSDLNEMQTMKDLIDTERLEVGRFEPFSIHLNRVAGSAGAVARWLDGRATRKMPFKEAEKELLNRIDTALASKRIGST